MSIDQNKEVLKFEFELTETKIIQMTQSEYQRYVNENNQNNSGG